VTKTPVLTGYSLCVPGPRTSSRTVVENAPISLWLHTDRMLLLLNQSISQKILNYH